MNVFPVQSSILSTTALAEYLVSSYGLPGPMQCRLLHHGDNDTYVVQRDSTKYILRVWSADERPIAELEAEMELLELLAQAQVPVGRPLRRKDTSFLHAVEAPEGRRGVGLFAFVPGQPPGAQMTAEHAHRYGAAAARLHVVADALPGRAARPPLDLERLLHAPLRRIAPLLAHRPAEWAYLNSLAGELSAYVDRLPRTAPAFGLCHGDLHKHNLLVDADGRVTLIDFDCCGDSWRAYELAVLVWSIGTLPQADAVREAYLNGYAEVRELAPEEVAAISYFVAIRDVFFIGAVIEQTQRGVDYGGAVDDAFFDRHLHFLQTWMAAIED